VPSPVDKTCTPAAGTGTGSGLLPCDFIFDSFPNGSGAGSGSGGCFALGVSTSGHEWLFIGAPGDWCKFGGVSFPLPDGPLGGGSLPVFKHNTRNHYATADYLENGSSGWALIARSNAAATSLIALNVTAADICVYEVTAGVPVLLGCVGAGGIAGANYKIEVEGTDVTVKQNALPILGPLPTSISTGLYTGQFDYDALTTVPVPAPVPDFDNFATGCL